MTWTRFLAPSQIVLGTVLALTSDPNRVAMWLFVVPAAFLLIWAVATMQPGRISIHTDVRDDAVLLVTGPYAWIRHPMYSALLLMTIGFWVSDAVVWRGFAVVALIVVLTVKSTVEEAQLVKRFAEYPAYTKRVGRFIPRLGRSPVRRP